MKIAIIGTGNVGSALASQWSKAGHSILLGVRDLVNFKGKALLENKNTTVHTIDEAANRAEIILFASPPQFTEAIARKIGDVTDKVIIDASNSVRSKPENYLTAFHAFEDLTNAEVVKCFNSTGFENMMNPVYDDKALDMFMAGDSEKAKMIVSKLAEDCGFAKCYDFGGRDRVELLEKFAFSWINLAIFQGMGRNMGFKILTK